VLDAYCHVCKRITPLKRTRDGLGAIRCGACGTDLREEARFAAPVEEPLTNRVRRHVEERDGRGAYRLPANRPKLRLDLPKDRGQHAFTIGALLFLGLCAAASLSTGDVLLNIFTLPFAAITASVCVSGEFERSTVWVDATHVRSVTRPLGEALEVPVHDITGVFVDQELTPLQSFSSVVLALRDGSEVEMFRSSAPDRARWLAWAIAHHLAIHSNEGVGLRVDGAIAEAEVEPEAEAEAEAEATVMLGASPDRQEEA
jgi:hypothetical protein